MYYFDTPILETAADAIVVPVSLKGIMPRGSLQWKVAAKLGTDYLEDYLTQLKEGHIKAGAPSLFFHDLNFPAIINFPVEDATGPIWLSDIVKGLLCMFDGLRTETIASVAVPWLCEHYSWDTVESVLLRMEELRGDVAKVQLWLYPPEDEEERATVSPRRVSPEAEDHIVETAAGKVMV